MTGEPEADEFEGSGPPRQAALVVSQGRLVWDITLRLLPPQPLWSRAGSGTRGCRGLHPDKRGRRPRQAHGSQAAFTSRMFEASGHLSGRGQKAGRKALGDVPRLDPLTMRQTPLPPAGPPDPTRPAPDGSVTAWPPAGALPPHRPGRGREKRPCACGQSSPTSGGESRSPSTSPPNRLPAGFTLLLRSTLFTRIRTPSRPEWLSARCSDP